MDLKMKSAHGNTVLLEVFFPSNHGISHTWYSLYIILFIRETYNRLCAHVSLTKLEVYQLNRMYLKSNMAVQLCFKPNASLSHASICILRNKIAQARSLPHCRMWTAQVNMSPSLWLNRPPATTGHGNVTFRNNIHAYFSLSNWWKIKAKKISAW